MAKCGAKTRSGGICGNPPVPGAKRCRFHGGKTPKGNRNAAKPGSLYSQYLSPEEQDAFEAMEIGRLEDELRLTRIRLARALAAEMNSQGMPEADSHTVLTATGGAQFSGATASETTTTKVRDYVSIIDRLTARVAKLEQAIIDLDLKRADLALKQAEIKRTSEDDDFDGISFQITDLTADD